MIGKSFEECGFGQPGSAVIYTGEELITNICKVNEVNITTLIGNFRELLRPLAPSSAQANLMERPSHAIGVMGGGKRRKTKRRKTKRRKTKRRKIKSKKNKKLRGGSGAAGGEASDPCKGFKDDLEIASELRWDAGELLYPFMVKIKQMMEDHPLWGQNNRVLLSNIGGRKDTETGEAKKAIVGQGLDDSVPLHGAESWGTGVGGRRDSPFEYTVNIFFSKGDKFELSWENMLIKYPYDLNLMDIVVWCGWTIWVAPPSFCAIINQKLRGTCRAEDRDKYESWRNILNNLVNKEWHGKEKHIQELVNYLDSPEMNLETIRNIVVKLYNGYHYREVECKRMYQILVDLEEQGKSRPVPQHTSAAAAESGATFIRNARLQRGYKNLYLNMCLCTMSGMDERQQHLELEPEPDVVVAKKDETLFMKEFPFTNYLLSEDRYLWRCDNPDEDSNYWLDSFMEGESFDGLQTRGPPQDPTTLSLDSVFLSQCSFCSFTYNKQYTKQWLSKSPHSRGFIFVLMGTLDENNEIVPTAGSAWQMTHTIYPEQKEILKGPCIYLIRGWEDKEEVIKSDGWDDVTKSVKYIYMYAIQGVGGWIIKELIEQLGLNLSENDKAELKKLLQQLIDKHIQNEELLNELVKGLKKVIQTADALHDPEKQSVFQKSQEYTRFINAIKSIRERE